MNILGTGLSGLVGSRIMELLTPKYTFEDLSYATGVDITDKQSVIEKISASSATTVFHLAAKTDVDGCEKEKDLGEESVAWKINVIGTKNIIEACEQTNKKLVYISTDMVFEGNKPLGEKYDTTDTPNPQNFYAKTKYESEKLLQTSSIPWAVIRIAYPFRSHFERNEYVRTFKQLLEQGKEFSAVADHHFTPVLIDDLAAVFEAMVTGDVTGVFHAVGSEVMSPYDAAIRIAEVFNLNKNLVHQTTRAEYFKDRAIRGFNLALKNDKIESLGIRMHTFTEGLEEIKKQL